MSRVGRYSRTLLALLLLLPGGCGPARIRLNQPDGFDADLPGEDGTRSRRLTVTPTMLTERIPEIRLDLAAPAGVRGTFRWLQIIHAIRPEDPRRSFPHFDCCMTMDERRANYQDNGQRQGRLDGHNPFQATEPGHDGTFKDAPLTLGNRNENAITELETWIILVYISEDPATQTWSARPLRVWRWVWKKDQPALLTVIEPPSTAWPPGAGREPSEHRHYREDFEQARGDFESQFNWGTPYPLPVPPPR